jgi:hypothetical protein
MANTQSMCTSFLGELMLGQHQLGASTLVSRGNLTAPTTDTVKALLVLASATVNASQTNVGTPGTGTPSTSNIGTAEVSGTGYTAGGVTVTNANPPVSANTSATAGTGYWTPSASITYTTVTLTTAFDTVVLYNSTQSGKTISVHTFGSQTITAGTFTLTMPSPVAATALLRLATT